MIHLQNITKAYSKNMVALKNVTLKIESGEFVSLVGMSGAGKTTLVKILIASEKADDGRVVVGGWDITDIRNSDVPYLRRQIGVVFQDYKLLDKKTIFENIAFALQVCGSSPARIKKLVPEVLDIVKLGDKKNRYPGQLSGGEKQRVAIARSLVHGPKILIADEPTGNLDYINSQEIIDLFLKINKIGITVLLVSHDTNLVDSIKKRVVVMEGGEILHDKEKAKYML